jgi:hypothetical protein
MECHPQAEMSVFRERSSLDSAVSAYAQAVVNQRTNREGEPVGARWYDSSNCAGVIFSVIKCFIPIERRAEAVEILVAMQGRLGICTDYIGSWIEERDQPCSHIVYVERWLSEEALYSHIQSSAYRHVLAVIEFSGRAPEINFFFVSQTKGIELIQDLREKSPPAQKTH